jgi:hypothetical protein
MFTLLGRDPSAHLLVRLWAEVRQKQGEDPAMVQEARDCADAMEAWAAKLGKDEKLQTTRELFNQRVDVQPRDNRGAGWWQCRKCAARAQTWPQHEYPDAAHGQGPCPGGDHNWEADTVFPKDKTTPFPNHAPTCAFRQDFDTGQWGLHACNCGATVGEPEQP